MPTLREVDLAWLDHAPVRVTSRGIVHHPPEAVFAAIAEDPARWGHWFPGFAKNGRYVTDAPHGVGAAREVTVGGLRFTERVLAWDTPSRWAFFVERAAIPLAAAMAEDYRVAPAPGGSEFTWTLAFDPGRLPRAGLLPVRGVAPLIMRRLCTNLDRYLSH